MSAYEVFELANSRFMAEQAGLEEVFVTCMADLVQALAADDAENPRKIVIHIWDGTNDTNLSSTDCMEYVRFALLLAAVPGDRIKGLVVRHCPKLLFLALAEALKRNTGLEYLSVSPDSADIEVCGALASALEENDSLRSFSILGFVTDEICDRFATALKDNCALRYFCIGGHFGDVGCITLATALKKNSCLLSVLVSGCFGDEGCGALADVLKENENLRFLRIGGEHIGSKECSTFAAAMKENTSLRFLQLYRIPLWNANRTPLTTPLDITEALELLWHNVTLIRCQVLNNKCADFVARNDSLRNTWAALTALARGHGVGDFVNLRSPRVREAVFAFLLPVDCRWPFYAQFSQQPLPRRVEQGDRGSSVAIDAPVESFQEEGAMDGSCAEAEKGEQDEDYSAAVKRSKSDEASPPLSADGQVILKITSAAHSQQVAHVFLNSPDLEPFRARVAEAGCEVMPAWANGAKLLVPFTEQQHEELVMKGKKLQGHHIVAVRSDIAVIKAALAQVRVTGGRNVRPRVQGDTQFLDLDVSEEAFPDTDSDMGFGQMQLD